MGPLERLHSIIGILFPDHKLKRSQYRSICRILNCADVIELISLLHTSRFHLRLILDSNKKFTDLVNFDFLALFEKYPELNEKLDDLSQIFVGSKK
jgi:hypothetical protein